MNFFTLMNQRYALTIATFTCVCYRKSGNIHVINKLQSFCSTTPPIKIPVLLHQSLFSNTYICEDWEQAYDLVSSRRDQSQPELKATKLTHADRSGDVDSTVDIDQAQYKWNINVLMFVCVCTCALIFCAINILPFQLFNVGDI